jgi:hypothetical protein
MEGLGMNTEQVCDRLKVVLSILAKPLDAASKRSGDDACWQVQAAQLEIVRDQLLELQNLVNHQHLQRIIMEGKI